MNHELDPVILVHPGAALAALALPVAGAFTRLPQRLPGQALWSSIGLI